MLKQKLYVLIACEESQAECKAFRELGHEAFSCDIQKCIRSGNPCWHINEDVRPFLYGCTKFITQAGTMVSVPEWDLVIAHPPCTYLSKAESMHLYKDPDYHISRNGETIEVNYDRLMKMKSAREFFLQCLDAKAPFVAVENPCPMAIAQLPKPNAFACPSWYGCKYAKKTYYWLKNLPPPMAGYINPTSISLVEHSRGKYRSRTYPGLAKALAEQWSEYILNIINQINYGNR